MQDKKIRIIFRRGSLGLKIAVLALITLSLASLVLIWVHKEQARADYERLRSEAIGYEHENSRLQEAIDELGTVQGIFQIAREALGLVDPNTVIIEPGN